MTNKYKHPWQVSIFQDNQKIRGRSAKTLEGYKAVFVMLAGQANYDKIMTDLLKDTPAQHGCGGTVISSSYVLTAAHCVDFKKTVAMKEFVDLLPPAQQTLIPQQIKDLKFFNLLHTALQPDEIFLVIGSKDLQESVYSRMNNPNFFSSEHIHQVADIKIHPDYSLGMFSGFGNIDLLHESEIIEYDYAIVTLKTKLTFSKTIVPACLPAKQASNQFSSYAGEEAWTSGWGDVTQQGIQAGLPKPDRLKELKVKVWTNQDCAKEWEKFQGVSQTRMKME